MNISLNDEPHEIAEGMKLKDFLVTLDLDDFNGWAVAINENVIPRNTFQVVILHEGDKLLLIQATQGG